MQQPPPIHLWNQDGCICSKELDPCHDNNELLSAKGGLLVLQEEEMLNSSHYLADNCQPNFLTSQGGCQGANWNGCTASSGTERCTQQTIFKKGCKKERKKPYQKRNDLQDLSQVYKITWNNIHTLYKVKSNTYKSIHFLYIRPLLVYNIVTL